MQHIFQHTLHVPGTLTANLVDRFNVPYDCKLLHVSAVSSNGNAASITIGTPSSASAYMAAQPSGEGGMPLEYARASFVDTQFPRVRRGNTVAVGVTHNSAANLTIVLTFAQG